MEDSNIENLNKNDSEFNFQVEEPPRLTSFLRIFGTEEGKNFDLQQEKLNQVKILRKLKKTRQSEGKISTQKKLENKERNLNQLNWSFFSEVAKDCDANELKEMRSVFHQLLKLILEIIGDIPSEEVHSNAFLVYNTLSNPNIDELQKKNNLGTIFGAIQQKDYSQLNNLVENLATWRKKFVNDNVSNFSDPETSSVEFGSYFSFDFNNQLLISHYIPSDEEDQEIPKETKSLTIKEEIEIPEPTKEEETSPGGYWEEIKSHPITRSWLLDICETFIASNTSHFSPQQLSNEIMSALKSKQSSTELQNTLFELLGDNGFEFIQLLIEKRNAIISAPSKDTPSSKKSSSNKKSVSLGHRPTSQIKIKIEDKQSDKVKKHSKDKEIGSDMAFNPSELAETRERELSTGPSMKLAPPGTYSSNNVVNQMVLPEGTTRKDTKTFREVSIPPQVHKPFAPNERLISIEEFDEYAQLAFQGYKSLNRIQSRLFEAAYRTNENLLICAPTGAGKTNVAVMTILHELGQHFENGKLIKDFKIIYVAPMKALAAEMTENFKSRLSVLGIVCKELTGDMQLTKSELQETQIVVTTPEKWDVITRKSGDMALTSMVRLLIIDEVHLLHEDRGPVIEVLIARTLRQVETTQSMIRIVGLSATLPNYKDVATFLRVNPNGLFYFDNSYRPVPLSQKFIGVKETNPTRSKMTMNEICYDKIIENLREGNQIMVFVHSRKDTVKTAEAIINLFLNRGGLEMLTSQAEEQTSEWTYAKRDVEKSRAKEVKNLFNYSFGCHHAGMLRSDRNLTERLFKQGLIKVLFCTATLAWGVNLPAHTVIIKGTQLYDAKQGTFVDLGMLDVMQIFGRAGRPQFDTSGEGIIITTNDKLDHYLALLNQQLPIESQFIKSLSDHLNAEIVLGTVTNISEAIIWLSYTYLHVRMLKNPLVYGITHTERLMDPSLYSQRRNLIINAARNLDQCRMIRFDERGGNFYATDLGRVASHYYIKHESVLTFNELLSEKSGMDESDVFALVSMSNEFENIMLREEEMKELTALQECACPIFVKGGLDNKMGKINVLFQSWLSHAPLDGFALISDSAYIVQNSTRILRGLFEIVMKKGMVSLAQQILTMCKMAERRMWDYQSPLRQFETIPLDIIQKLEKKKADIDKLADMDAKEIGQLVDHPRMGSIIKKCVNQFPYLEMDVQVHPITRTVLRVNLILIANFEWNDKVHSSVEPFWIWIEDAENEHIYHSEYFLLYKKNRNEPHKLTFTIPIFEPLPPQYYVRIISDRWLGCDSVIPMSFKHLILPHQHPPHTELLDLQPLPKTALHNPEFEKLFKFSHFNPIQTQLFHTLYHTDQNILLGAPTGSGKTITAELAMLKLFRDTPHLKVVYIGPLKALVRERLKDWSEKFGKNLGKVVVELTGDYTPNIRALQQADIVTTTPEKWDGISRNWQQRSYVKAVGLIILDEIHLLGEERGPILEVIVSRMRYISAHTDNPCRIVGLSTALANAKDLADWLGIEKLGLFNFRPSVRPVPLQAFIQGYSGKHYCPRMATMNKPAYAAIITHSPEKPVLIFVSSRRQTRLTAIDLITFASADEQPRRFLRMSEDELEQILDLIDDLHLRHTLSFGIGLHHAGLPDRIKAIIEDLFEQNKIQVLVSTSTLAWGVNLPAHLVIIKGTEFFDPKTKRYEDFPITDVLQMMGRAGRPQYDTEGKAVIMVQEEKKNFYKKFLYEPFPVESSLPAVLHDHLCAEIVSGTVTSKQDAVDYLTWTFFFRRLLMNPSYYDLEDSSFESINSFLSKKIDSTLEALERAHCISVEDDVNLKPLTLGKIASFYYLHYTTAQLFKAHINANNDIPSLLTILTKTSEYEELPVRHNEEKLNEVLANQVPWKVDTRTYDSPHTKAHLLLQAHFSHLPLPISDYVTDLKSVLDQAVRILQAMVDVAADSGYLFTALNSMHLLQMIMSGRWFTDSTLLLLPHFDGNVISTLYMKGIESLPELLELPPKDLNYILSALFPEKKLKDILQLIPTLPVMNVKFKCSEQTFSPNEEAILKVELTRLYKYDSNKGAYTPGFAKYKDEGWWLVVGNPIEKELVALRRINFQQTNTSTTLTFKTPEKEGQYSYSLYLLSDCYRGVDQQYQIPFQIKK